MRADIGLEDDAVAETAKMLNQVLSDEFLLYTKTLCCHWNIQGADFRSLHLLLEDQYTSLSEMIDTIAERVRAIGERSLGSLAGFHEHTRIKEFAEHRPLPDAQQMLSNLKDDHEAIVKELRLQHVNIADRQHDVGTTSLIEDLILKHEKMAWFLRAQLND